MKNLYYIFILAINFIFVACQSEITVNEIIPPIKVEEKTVSKTWQEQVNFAMSHTNKATRSYYDRVRLIDYNYLYKISSEEQTVKFWDDFFSDEVDIVIYPNGNITDYEIVSFNEAIEKYPTLDMDKRKEYLKEQLDSVVNIGTELIELNWEYRGRIIRSTAIIHKGKIVYDHIGCMIIIQETIPQQPTLETDVTPIKTTSRNTGLYERYWKLSDHYGQNFMGNQVWEYEIFCSAHFRPDGILASFTCYANSKSEFGWYCEAKVQQTGGQINISNYCQFTWGYAYRFGFPVSVEIYGTQVSITPGVTQSSGTFQLKK